MLEEEEEEAGRRIREAMEGETGDLMRLALRIGTLLVGRGRNNGRRVPRALLGLVYQGVGILDVAW